jgi:hypothetical protein
MIIYDKPHASIDYNPDTKIGFVVWKSNCTMDQYRDVFENMLAYAKTHLMKYVLSDTTNQGVVSPENRKWFEKEMIPAAIEVGLEKVAIITDANVFKRYYLNMLLSAVNKFGVPFKIFGNEGQAKAFLLEEETVAAE